MAGSRPLPPPGERARATPRSPGVGAAGGVSFPRRALRLLWGRWRRTPAPTTRCGSRTEGVRRPSRNVKHWGSGEMTLRWTAAGMLEAERQFRRIIGYRDLAKLG